MNKKIISLVLFLGIVSAVSGLILGYVNSITAPLIEANSMAAEAGYLSEMYPGGSFSKGHEELKDSTIQDVYVIEGQGYAFKCTTRGFDEMTVLVGLDNEGTVVGLIPLNHNETAGFGGDILKDQGVIANMYVGRGLNDAVDMKAGATLTSNALKAVIDTCREAFKQIG